MKKQIAVILATGALSLSVMAQGSIFVDATLPAFGGAGGITTQGASATSIASATTWLNIPGTAGNNFSLSVYFVPTASFTGTYSIATINSYLNVSGGVTTALADMAADGFTMATAAPVSGNVNYGAFNFATSLVNLPNVTTSATGYMALLGTSLTGSTAGWEGVVAFGNQSAGGNPAATPAGNPASLTGWNTLAENLVLSPVPEPATLAMAALGGASLLLFRRRK